MAEPAEQVKPLRLNGFVDEGDKALFDALNAVPSPRKRMRRFRDLALKGLLYEQFLERGEMPLPSFPRFTQPAQPAPQPPQETRPAAPPPPEPKRSVTEPVKVPTEKDVAPVRKKGTMIDMSMLDLVDTSIMSRK